MWSFIILSASKASGLLVLVMEMVADSSAHAFETLLGSHVSWSRWIGFPRFAALASARFALNGCSIRT